jgi:RHS repeat-associated protein
MLTRHHDYEAFGQGVHTGTAEVVTQPFAFTARRDDRRAAHMHLRSRQYRPECGAFISRDPSGFSEGPNPYRAYFVPNYADPSGHFAASIVGSSFDKRGTYDVFVRYELHRAPCTGFVVQRIRFIEGLSKCPKLPWPPITYPFFEVLGGRYKKGQRVKITDYWSGRSPFTESLGVELRVSTVKFFCEDPKDDPQEQDTGVGDLYEDLPPGWSLENPMAPGAPTGYDKPHWWDKPSAAAEGATARMAYAWCCCSPYAIELHHVSARSAPGAAVHTLEEPGVGMPPLFGGQ